MTSNQRRPGFRLPWATETGTETADSAANTDQATLPAPESSDEHVAASAGAESAAVPAPADSAPAEPSPAETAPAETAPAEPGDSPESVKAAEGAQPPVADEPVADAPEAPAAVTQAVAAPPESSAGFMRDLVEAMRRVAEETRQAGLSELRTKADEQVRTLEASAEERREQLKGRAEADVSGVGEWAQTESERIKQEAEQRVVARRAQLDQQLAGETARAEADAKALRDRVDEYERELDAYHVQLSDIADPAAFAAAAKRMPPAPTLDRAPDARPTRTAPLAASTNGIAAVDRIHPAEEEVLASRLAELDASLGGADGEGAPAAADAPTSTESTSTEILVKGLGSFGAITGFRQALAGVDGIEGVSLSLGPTGEFVFRAIHHGGFDVAAAISKLEADAAKIEHNADGGLRVTLDRAR